MDTKTKLIVCAVALAGSFAAGRFTVPEKVKTVTQIVEVDKIREDSKTDTNRDTHKETTTTEVVKPDGTKETTTKTVVDSNTDRKTQSDKVTDDTRTSQTTKEGIAGTQKVTVSALGAIKLGGTPQVTYGAAITKPILGPITVGVFGLTDGVVGCSIGLTF